jgi:transposase InsO family protein
VGHDAIRVSASLTTDFVLDALEQAIYDRRGVGVEELVIHRKGPWRHLEAVEFATLTWIDWLNTWRLLEPIGYVPPAEYEAGYLKHLRRPTTAEHGVAAEILEPAAPDDRRSWGIL